MSQLKHSMRGRLVRIMLVISGLTGIATFAIVAMMSARSSAQHLAAIQRHIEEGIASKGKVLTDNHALALRGLILDNAFVDMQRLVERAVQEDQDLVYGVVVNAERETLALSQMGQQNSGTEKAGAEVEPSARAAVLSLGLAEAELLVDERVVKRVNRLGQDLLEVAVPVISDEGEKLGTIRYGLSTARMHEALGRAAAERDRDLWRSLSWIASLVGVTTLLGLLLSRIQAIRITSPVVQLTQAARDLGSGNRNVRVNISSGDELELLGSTFNHMVDELGSSYQKLEEMNRTLEHKVESRTAEIALQSRDMRLVLDNVDQGLLTLSPEGRLAKASSRLMSEWFGDQTEGAGFGEYIGKTSRSFSDHFEFAWAQVMDGVLPLELAIDQLPQRLTAEGRTWSFRYLPYFEQMRVAGVLVVCAEITERLAREREEAEQRELMNCFTRLMRDPSGFVAFASEAGKMIHAVTSRALDAEPVVLKQTLHTLKGNSAMMGMDLVAAACHELEDQLLEHAAMADHTLTKLADSWCRIAAQVSELAPRAEEQGLQISLDQHAALVAALSELPQHRSLLEQVRGLRLEPAAKSLGRLAQQARALAQRLGKSDLEVVVEAEGVRLEPEPWRPFFCELVHVLRNAVDHGIETPEERQRAGKPLMGKLTLAARASRGELTFEISDDGRGIAWELVAAEAAKRGLPHETPSDLVEALCADGLSTRHEITETSGRGVGMSAFRRAVAALRGRIEVKSSPRGTSWLIHIPLPESAPASIVFAPNSDKELGEQRLSA